MTKSKSSEAGIARPYSLGTYAKLMVGTVILIGLNFIFTKLFDQVYGTVDLAANCLSMLFPLRLHWI